MDSPISLETAKSLGPVAIIVSIVVTLGVVAFKFRKKVKIVINELTDGKLSITINNLSNKRVMVTYHFKYEEFTSKKFNTILNKKETKSVEVSDEILDGVQVDKLKFVVDNVKPV